MNNYEYMQIMNALIDRYGFEALDKIVEEK